MKKSDVSVRTKDTPFRGFFHIDRYRLKHRKFDGGWSDEMEREVFERGHAVVLLPYDPIADRFVMIEQFRAGAFAALASPWFDDDTSPWLIEGVAGMIGDGETPHDVARRETVEETGCELLGEPEFAFQCLASPGGTSESVFVYAGCIDSRTADGIHGLDHEHEDIRVFTLGVDEAYQWMAEGRINNAVTMLSLYWFRDHRDRLREKWRGLIST